MSGVAVTFPELGQPYTADESLLASLRAIAAEIAVPEGSVLFRQGDPVRGIYVVESGRISLTMTESGRRIKYRSVSKGYILGLPATICDQPYSLTAEASEASVVRFIEQIRVVEFLRGRSDLCLRVVEILGHELTDMRKAKAKAAAPAKSVTSHRKN
jgi:CRP/FNR family transcriptional regulator, cyclic AMP receptor protein